MLEAMTCPGCGGQMAAGRLRVKGTLSGFLLVGFSLQDLWWSDLAESRESRERVIGSGGQRPAHRCIACGMIAFAPFDP
jgi:hypothetical protein